MIQKKNCEAPLTAWETLVAGKSPPPAEYV